MHPRHERYPVRACDVDAFGELGLPALTGLLLDAAGRHAADLGCGLPALQARGLTWVLVRLRVEAPAPTRLDDLLEVATWPSGIHGLIAAREFRVTRAGEEVARASSDWLVLDMGKRRPVRPSTVLDPALRPVGEPVAPIPVALPAPGPHAPVRRLDVRYADIDLNQHVTTASYLAWALESVPEARWRAARACAAEAHFLAEAVLGDAVLARAAEEGPGEVVHELEREGGGEALARVRTRWAPRG